MDGPAPLEKGRVVGAAAVRPLRLRLALGGAVLRRTAIALAALWLFVIAVRTLSNGAKGIEPLLDLLSVHSPANALGFAWLGAYGVLSGSPIAAVAVTLFDGGLISRIEAFAMLNGSRFGASFIVLVVGFLSYVRHRKEPDGVYIGVIALLTAFAMNLPVLFLGVALLRSGLLDGAQFDLPGLTSAVEVIADPAVNRINDAFSPAMVFAAGVALLLVSFQLFDRALPQLEAADQRFERMVAFLHRRWAMFAVGLLMTFMTMSVSISLTVLVPLSLKGYIRRNGIVPYVMGANISTWIDTLVATLLMGNPDAFVIVLTEMVSGFTVALVVLSLFYHPFERAILRLTRRIVTNRRSLAAFLGAIFLVPLVLLFAAP